MTTKPALRISPAHSEQLAAWDGDEGNYWAAHPGEFDQSLHHYHQTFMDAAEIERAAVVLDVGCGTGQTTRDAARLASGGHCLGVDLSGSMLQVARDVAAREGVTNLEFRQADAAVEPFESQVFDAVISRTALMFFADKPAAFAHLADAMRPGGRLTALVWQPLERNEWVLDIFAALAAGRDFPAPPADGPQPFSMSDPDRVRGWLGSSGFDNVEIGGLERPFWLGDTVESAHDLIAGLMGWMIADLDPDARRRALDDLERRITAHQTPGGVVFGSAAWLVTANRSR
ncbi:MAG TPA: methyltransferase domain-containing protein [Nocardioidaceae bacterium]|nr:methyltransferase domain-containing protein [Nocardioidaceae bacterium]